MSVRRKKWHLLESESRGAETGLMRIVAGEESPCIVHGNAVGMRRVT